jgi:GNAT superfamily N-acetyltransferase
MTGEREPFALEDLRVVPANQAPWEDLQAVLGTRGDASRCQCQRFKLQRKESFASLGVEELSARLREQTHCGQPQASETSGLVAYLEGEPVGWCAVEPRSAYDGLRRVFRVPWDGRDEDRADATVWAVTCFTVRAGYRHRGISRALARAAADFARERGARAIECYPLVVAPGEEISWGELHVGERSVLADAGFEEVNAPTKRRVVMRIDF